MKDRLHCGFTPHPLEIAVKYLNSTLSTLTKIMVTFCHRMLLLLGISMTLLILLQVFFRFVIYVPFPWSEEAARYLMIWMGMLGSVVALENKRHIGVDFFVGKMPQILQSPIRIAVQGAMAIFLGILCVQGIHLCMYNYDQLSPAMEISMLIPFGAIPMGCAMMVVVVLKGICTDLSTPKTPEAAQ